MKAYLALTRINLKLALREKPVLFFNYVFPLLFFFTFSQMYGARNGAISQIVAMVLVFGVLGSGLFGAGIRTVVEREANILRRYKVAPISPAPLLVASIVVGWILYLPSVLLLFGLAHFVYGMPVPPRWLSLLVFISLGASAMRAVGLIVASVVNSVAESNIVVQLLYMPMLFLSGAMVPLGVLPSWAQTMSQFLPTTYLFIGIQSIVLRKESLLDNVVPAGAMALSVVVSLWISMRLFRWEKEQRIPNSSKAWIAAVFLPFLVLGGFQAHSRENIRKTQIMQREVHRNRSTIIHGARIFVGDGTVLPTGTVVVSEGHIQSVGSRPAGDQQMETIEAAGKTLLPGLIDVRVHFDNRQSILRDLAAYLYCGVTTVATTAEASIALAPIESGERLGARLFLTPVRTRYESLSSVESAIDFQGGETRLLGRFLVAQVGLPELIESTKQVAKKGIGPQNVGMNLQTATATVLEAWRSGTPLVTGTDGGRLLLLAGPTVQREVELLVKGGIPSLIALQAATGNGAMALKAGDHLGFIKKGYEADLLLVDGNPLEDVSTLERISEVFVRGERIDRTALLKQK